jgi:hypothetical protein
MYQINKIGLVTQIERDASFAGIRDRIRSWKKEREPEEITEVSFVGEDVLTIDTDEEIL